MPGPQGPLDIIPKSNYSSLITMANYFATKQMIDQVLSEDHEYVLWKMKSMRTGGTMEVYDNLNSKKRRRGGNDDRSNEMTTKIRRIGNGNGVEEMVNEVPKGMVFPKDVRDEKLHNVHFPRILDQDEQFRLLVTNLDSEQTNRFEVFHRTSLNKSQVKKLAGTVINQSVTENIRVFLQAVGKIFAGEIIELALDARQKWLLSKMDIQYERRKYVGKRLKKFLKKLTLLVERNDEYEDSVDENESDTYFDDDKDEMEYVKNGNKLLKLGNQNPQEVKIGLIDQYNKLVKEFNTLDVSIEKYSDNSPILPEHIREAWRLYQLQSETSLSPAWRTQGEGNGWMFR
ncbi:hypothetical protein Kpol_1004p35 [Vanderwaltozyma polyspora DSM 70294]|uniref:TAFII28-like protein domain-containing protein n=1 Tax=Vanderwaltozyma polyspora (strain ATCC 22028 / DSM 70294 / BCRC 21397 / CBS 2163 / NBRC 10782 / NRRL Y-8283 / UCD 57-17) TaxID=436907 RepID=A7TJ92_VANPO|nr:uncharacterized protein Kpol_1004p35 [Vanderwaltozyma polyspora DSM 70294]EDO17661.1 hypothetical protein Kpol_1004p35 [Vanderwaltozyma polyspora DSM 70294]